MTTQEAIDIIRVAIAEVEWEYPMEYAVAFEKAVVALKRSVPAAPKVLVDTWVCGDCGARLERQCLIGPDVLMDENFNYCPGCGRKVDWSATSDS